VRARSGGGYVPGVHYYAGGDEDLRERMLFLLDGIDESNQNNAAIPFEEEVSLSLRRIGGGGGGGGGGTGAGAGGSRHSSPSLNDTSGSRRSHSRYHNGVAVGVEGGQTRGSRRRRRGQEENDEEEEEDVNSSIDVSRIPVASSGASVGSRSSYYSSVKDRRDGRGNVATTNAINKKRVNTVSPRGGEEQHLVPAASTMVRQSKDPYYTHVPVVPPTYVPKAVMYNAPSQADKPRPPVPGGLEGDVALGSSHAPGPMSKQSLPHSSRNNDTSHSTASPLPELASPNRPGRYPPTAVTPAHQQQQQQHRADKPQYPSLSAPGASSSFEQTPPPDPVTDPPAAAAAAATDPHAAGGELDGGGGKGIDGGAATPKLRMSFIGKMMSKMRKGSFGGHDAHDGATGDAEPAAVNQEGAATTTPAAAAGRGSGGKHGAGGVSQSIDLGEVGGAGNTGSSNNHKGKSSFWNKLAKKEGKASQSLDAATPVDTEPAPGKANKALLEFRNPQAQGVFASEPNAVSAPDKPPKPFHSARGSATSTPMKSVTLTAPAAGTTTATAAAADGSEDSGAAAAAINTQLVDKDTAGAGTGTHTSPAISPEEEEKRRKKSSILGMILKGKHKPLVEDMELQQQQQQQDGAAAADSAAMAAAVTGTGSSSGVIGVDEGNGEEMDVMEFSDIDDPNTTTAAAAAAVDPVSDLSISSRDIRS